MSYKSVKNFLKNNKNPESYNFEFEFDIYNHDKALSTWDRYCIYRAYRDKKLMPHILKENKIDINKYHEPGHLDGSDGRCTLTLELYSKLWNWEKEYSNFGKINCFENLFGGDTINSVQTTMNYCLKQVEECVKDSIQTYLELYCRNRECLYFLEEEFTGLKEFIDIYHTIGNFVLVPAYFNVTKSSKGLYDFFDAGLYKLQKEVWNIEIKRLNYGILRIKNAQSLITSLGKEKKLLEDKGIESNKFDKFLDELEKVNPQNDVPKELLDEIREEIIKIYRSNENQGRFTTFSPDDFNRYINTMFLWDYTFSNPKDKKMYSVKSLCKGDWSDANYKTAYDKTECRSYEMKTEEIKKFISNAQYAIKRRSLFMVAMLRIALGIDLDGEEKNMYETVNRKNPDKWNDWSVSEIYKKITEEVFLIDSPYSNGYEGVIKKIRGVTEGTEDNDFVERILNQLVKDISKL